MNSELFLCSVSSYPEGAEDDPQERLLAPNRFGTSVVYCDLVNATAAIGFHLNRCADKARCKGLYRTWTNGCGSWKLVLGILVDMYLESWSHYFGENVACLDLSSKKRKMDTELSVAPDLEVQNRSGQTRWPYNASCCMAPWCGSRSLLCRLSWIHYLLSVKGWQLRGGSAQLRERSDTRRPFLRKNNTGTSETSGVLHINFTYCMIHCHT